MNRFLPNVKNLVRHELITGSFYIFAGGLAASFLAFLFNLYMARNLSYSDYGILASLISLFTLAIIPSQSITSTIIRFATSFFAKEETGRASAFYKKLSVFWWVFSLFTFGIVWLFSSQIASFLHIANSSFVVICGVAIALAYASMVNISFIQSLLKFKYLAFSYTAGAIVKMALGVFFIVWGFSVGGALFAIVSMSIMVYFLGFFPLRFLLKNDDAKNVPINWLEIIRYALPTIIVVLSVTSLVTTDVILVKHFFPPNEAGLYGGISLIGKVIFYFTAPIASVMFPLIVKKHTREEDFRGLFHLSMLLVFLSSLAITIFYFILPEFSIRFFLGGGDYLKIASFIGLFGILITIYSLLNIVVNFFLSIKKTEIVIPCFFASAFQVVLIFLYHENFQQVIYITISSCALLLATLLLYYIKQYGLHYASK